MYFDARRTKRKQTLCIFTEIEDLLFGMERTISRLVKLMFCHGTYQILYKEINLNIEL
jgi:hypothetical protein